MVFWRVYYVVVRILGRLYVFMKYVEKKLLSFCFERFFFYLDYYVFFGRYFYWFCKKKFIIEMWGYRFKRNELVERDISND